MADIEALLNRWQTAGALDAKAAARIRAFEAESGAAVRPDVPGSSVMRQPFIAGVKWQGLTALILGAILLACGVALFVSAHWDELGPMARFVLVVSVVAVIHLAGAVTREKFHALSTALHAVGTLSIGAAIALVGQIFNLQEHWPSAVLLWAMAALAGWILLRDQAQETLALLLIPAWMVCEIEFYGQGHIGDSVYMGRMLFAWAVLYLTFFVGSRRKVVQGILFAAAAIAALVGIAAMLDGWVSFSSEQTFLPFSTRFWCWVAIAVIPLIVAAFHGHKGLIPIAVAIAFDIFLPWCLHTFTQSLTDPTGRVYTYVRTEPNLAAHVGVATFTIFLCVWGIRLASKALVNLGIVGFAVAVGWFYFSDIYSALGRSLGLIGLGILFLAGGWALEKMRRRIVAGMDAGMEGAAQ